MHHAPCRALVSELDMLKLWKGIYFCFWHSDKEPVQVCRGRCSWVCVVANRTIILCIDTC